jgi:TatD DNase family protein
MKYFDIHSHLNLPEFKDDLEEAVSRMEAAEIGTIVVGTDFETSKLATEIAEKYKNIWACIGVHPVDDAEMTFKKDKFDDLVKNPKVVAIGECGLDFFHSDKAQDYERQKELFLKQAGFALEYDKPLMIHARSAYPELLKILESLKVERGEKLRGNVHFFAGTLEEAKRFWKIGFTTSFTGVITFTRNYDEVIRNAPLEMIMSETDAPFVAPVPYRGKRNEPSYVSEVVKKIAEIRGNDEEIVRSAMLKNVSRMFSLNLA